MTVLLGRTTAGTSGDFVADGRPVGSKFTAAASGTLATIFAQFKVNNAGLTSVELGIYDDSGGGLKPGAKLASGTTTDAAIKGTGSFSVTGFSVPITLGTVYWLAWRGVGEQQDFQGTAAGSYAERTASVALEATWGANATGATDVVIWGEDAAVTASATRAPTFGPRRTRARRAGPRTFVERRQTFAPASTTDTAVIGGANASGIIAAARADQTIGQAAAGGIVASASAAVSVGGATANGISPTVAASTAPAGASAQGIAAGARATESIAGAAAQGITAASTTTTTIGGATAGGITAAARVAVSAAGATSGGIAPTDSASTTAAASVGGAAAGGINASARTTASIGAAIGVGIPAGAYVTVVAAGAIAGGIAPTVTVPSQPVDVRVFAEHATNVTLLDELRTRIENGEQLVDTVTTTDQIATRTACSSSLMTAVSLSDESS